jgi:hypothetical protein
MAKITTIQELSSYLAKTRPQGTLKFPRLVDAFDGNKYSNGKYTCQINMPKGDALSEEVVAAINGLHKAIGGDGVVIKDGDALNKKGQRTAPGQWIMNLKATAQTVIKYVDSQGHVIRASTFEDGDTVRVRITAFDYTQSLGRPGISLWFKSMQLVRKSEGDFDAIEGGYDATLVPEVDAGADADTDADDADDTDVVLVKAGPARREIGDTDAILAAVARRAAR